MRVPFPYQLPRTALAAACLILALSCPDAGAGVQATADKEVAEQQTEADDAFPLTFTLSTGGESEFVFRGVNILPEVDINEAKALTEAINMVPGYRDYILRKFGDTPKQFVEDYVAKHPKTVSATPREISRDSGIYYVDGHVYGYGFVLGVFYATQDQDRVDDHGLSKTPDPIIQEYHEFDSYLSYSHPVGPVNITLRGTFYHPVARSDFNTAEFEGGVAYTPARFRYVTASFTYDYASAFDIIGHHVGPGVRDGYLDGHYLETRISGYVPLYKQVVTFNPYVLVSAGAGIEPRAFVPGSFPTFLTTEQRAKGLEPNLNRLLTLDGPGLSPSNPAAKATTQYDPAILDRSFDLSNFQVGFHVPIYLTKYITVSGDVNYSRPLGNLDREPYNQRDEFWGGASVTLGF